MEHQISEHKRALTRGNTAQSTIAVHVFESQSHVINEKAKVVDTHPHYHQLDAHLSHAWHIRLEITMMIW